MAFQLAHYRMHGHSASTYEAASTAAFKHGGHVEDAVLLAPQIAALASWGGLSWLLAALRT